MVEDSDRPTQSMPAREVCERVTGMPDVASTLQSFVRSPAVQALH